MATKTRRSTRARRASSLRVMVTGGTGFVGFHTVRALHEAGHEVRLLVRSPDKLKQVFGPFGMGELDHVRGDIADVASVEKALAGCDAVVHAAAMVNVHAQKAAETIQTNRRGTELVIGGAVARGIERIVQVSSSSALFNPGLAVVDEDSPLGAQPVGYGRSKIESDLFVRGLQAKGAPVYTTYPGSVLGPDDPGMSEAVRGLKALLDDVFVVTSSGIQIVDVRDLGIAHLKLIERGGPPARYTMGGQFFPWPQFADLLESVIGAKLRRVGASGRLLQGIGRIADLLHPWLKIELPISYEAMWYATEWTPSNDERVQRELGFRYRDIRETLGDTILWLGDRGLLKHPGFADHVRATRGADAVAGDAPKPRRRAARTRR